MKRALIFLLSLTVLVSIGVIKCSNDGRHPPSTTSPAGGRENLALAAPAPHR